MEATDYSESAYKVQDFIENIYFQFEEIPKKRSQDGYVRYYKNLKYIN
jgi:hypothetical protein